MVARSLAGARGGFHPQGELMTCVLFRGSPATAVRLPPRALLRREVLAQRIVAEASRNVAQHMGVRS